MKRNTVRYCLAAVLLLVCTFSHAIPAKPQPPRLVNDLAGLFTLPQTQRLEHVLTAFDDSTSNQITVVTTNDLEGYTPAEYGTRIGLDWGVGSAEFNNGVVVVVKPKTRDSNGQVNISVGYGLEGAIPDAYAKRIIDNEMIPRFAEGDYFGGVAAGCTVLMQLASGEISEPRGDDDLSIGGIFTIAIFLFIFAVILLSAIFGRRHGGGNSGSTGGGPDLMDTIIIGSLLGSHGRSSGWGGSGGGFSGGFGGFGGGSFGGGGASGSW
ncbi:MAG: TPM domain-containing protein [Bacteroidetes bacterium]|uniref:TPM domain-containing protein n=1 Tax=Candidatus Cryptobacteroides merdavium TaxID=2840769 RepID=A0A9D9EBQ3_9BACT|nr:TPM domain-containing protein [Candidatus Cryptobacteroides merdavium]